MTAESLLMGQILSLGVGVARSSRQSYSSQIYSATYVTIKVLNVFSVESAGSPQPIISTQRPGYTIVVFLTYLAWTR